MPTLNEDQQRAMVSELVAVVKKYTPEWTDQPDSDPGIALLELFTWLGDLVLFRTTATPDRKRRVLTRLRDKLNSLSQD